MAPPCHSIQPNILRLFTGERHDLTDNDEVPLTPLDILQNAALKQAHREALGTAGTANDTSGKGRNRIPDSSIACYACD